MTVTSKASLERMKSAGLRPTRQRLSLADLLFKKGDRHVTAEQLHGEAIGAGVSVSLATVYNTLNQFTKAGLLREVTVEAGRSYFDTNVGDHHHFYVAESGQLIDIPDAAVAIGDLPNAPDGMRVSRVDVVVRVEPATDGG